MWYVGQRWSRRQRHRAYSALCYAVSALLLEEGGRFSNLVPLKWLLTERTATGQRQQARTELFAAIDLYRAMAMTFWLPEAEAARAQVEGE